MRFGWECICGQDSRVARQEADQIDRLVVNGGESAIQKIMSSLAVQDDKKFTMERL